MLSSDWLPEENWTGGGCANSRLLNFKEKPMNFKKIWRKGLLLAVLAMALLTVCAGAEENELLPQQMESEQPAEASEEPVLVYFDDLYIGLNVTGWAEDGDGEASLFGATAYESMKETLRDGIAGKKAEISITNGLDRAITVEECRQLYYNTLYGYPELTFYARTAISLSYYSMNPGETIIFKPQYLETYDSDAYRRAVDAAASECFTADMTPLEKVVAAHDWIVLNCQYDPYVANGGQYTTAGGVTYGKDEKVYTSYGVFVDGNAVCQGYALALKVLMDRAGIPCCYVSSESMNHAWNMVQLDGNWYHADVTWGDPVGSGIGDIAGHISRDFFIKSDAEFIAGNGRSNHSGWTSEYGYTTPAASYDMPEAISASCTGAYLIDGSFYVLSNGTLYSCPIGSNFASGTAVATGISTGIYAAAYDDTRYMYFLGDYTRNEKNQFWWSIYELDLKAASPVPQLKKQTTPTDGEKTYGLCMRESDSFPGAKELCTWYDYAAVESVLVGVASTAADMPVVIRYPSSMMQIENLAGKSILVTSGTLPADVTGGTIYLACYDKAGKMEKIVALGALGTSTMKIESTHLSQNAKTAKILTVSNLGTPLATCIPCS